MAEPMQCTEEDALSHDGFVENGQENGSESGRYISDTEMEDRQAESEAQRSQESPRCSQLPLSQSSPPRSQASPPRSQLTPPRSQLSPPRSQSSPLRSQTSPLRSQHRDQSPSEQGSSQGSSASASTEREAHRQRTRRRLPASYMRAGTITDRTRFPLELRRYYHEAGLLVPRPQDLRSIESQSKSFSMVEAEDLHPSAGHSWSFVDVCKAGLSDELRKVMFLFDVLNGLSNHHPWNGFVVPTDGLGGAECTKLQPKYAADNKTITGVLFSELQDSDDEPERRNSMLEDDSGDLQTGTVFRSMPLLSINLGFTLAIFNSGSDKEEFVQFGVVTVTSLVNVDSLNLILDRLLAPPPVRTTNFEKVSKRQSELRELFEHLIIYQASGVMGDTSTERPRDYFCNPSGRLGIDKVCHPGFEPYKMAQLIFKNYPRPRNIKIVGYPQLDWGSKDHPAFRNHWNYVRGQRGHQMQLRAELRKAVFEFTAKKEKKRGHEEEEKEEWMLPSAFGWPVRANRDWYVEFVGSLCPVNMQLRRLREVDVNDNYHSWSLNLGSLPPLALCLLRCCLLFDPTNPDASRLDGILLRELDVQWDLAMIRQRFYTTQIKVHNHVAVPGSQLGGYKEILRYIQQRVQDKSMSPDSAVGMLSKAMDYGAGVFVGMAESNSFLSERVTQAMEIMQKLSQEERRSGSGIGRGLRAYCNKLLDPGNARCPDRAALMNPYDRARRFLLRCFEDVNRFEHLNSGNMRLKIEVMIAMIGYTMGYDNETHNPFGRAVELAPGCGTLCELLHLGGKSSRVRVVANANSAGKDFSCNKVTEVFAAFCEQHGVGKSLQGVRVLARFTPVSMENLTTLQFRDGEIISYPDASLNGFFYIMTESRGNAEGEQDALIKFAYTRGSKQEKTSLTTCEGDHKVRSLMWKEPMSSINLVIRCSNEPLPSVKANEQSDTIAAVTMVLEAGSSVYDPGVQEGTFGSHRSNPYEARSVPLEGHTAMFAPDLLAGTHLHCTTYMGLPNVLGTYLCEICPPTLAVLDWLSFFSQKHLESLFHPRCKGNHLRRLMQVSEARATSFTAWCKMLQHLTDCPDRETAIKRAVASFRCDAVALTDCPAMLWGLIRRCLHWGPILYSCCFIRECKMPIVPTHVLAELLRAPARPLRDSALRPWYDKVAQWLHDCIRENRFCPIDGTGQFSEYVSSAGQADGATDGGVLRVNLSYNAWNDKLNPRAAPTRIAAELFNAHGAELHHSCSVTKDSMACALEDMLTEFSVDLQKLLEANMFDMERHLKFFGIHDKLDFKCQDRFGAHPYAVKCHWQRDPRDVVCVGAGVHFVQLLVLGSMIGYFAQEQLHPKLISDLSFGLLTQILRFAPGGILPGGLLEIPSFSCFNGRLESQLLDANHMEAENFIRPNDVFFAESGELSRCRNVENFAVEDVMHMGPLCQVAKLIGCKVVEVPASVDVTYYIRPRKLYCVHNPLSGILGYLQFDGVEAVLEHMHPDDVSMVQIILPVLSWQERLRELGFTMLPMIFRSGACVAWEGRVGCVVPQRDAPDGNFSPASMDYAVRLGQEERVSLPVLTALEMLLPIGQRLYLRLEAPSAAPVVPRLNKSVPSQHLARCALRVHLDSPNTIRPIPGKVYVVCLVRKLSGNDQLAGSCVEVLVVDPWELLLMEEGRALFEHVSE